MSIRALIVDDHPVTREGLRTALELSEDAVVVVGVARRSEVVPLPLAQIEGTLV